MYLNVVMATFVTTINPTAFGFFDSDTVFQQDADSVVLYVKRFLGDEILSVELTKKQIWTAFEQAVLKYNQLLAEWSLVSNLSNVMGMTTGSSSTSLNITEMYIKPTLNYLIRQAEPYAEEVGIGGNYDNISGSIDLIPGVQDYNIYTSLKDSQGNLLANLYPSGTSGKLKIFEVFHDFPVIPVWNSNVSDNYLVGNGGWGNDFGNIGGLEASYATDGTRFYVLPVFEDVLRANELQTAQRVRRSHWSYRITGRNIRIFPVPQYSMSGSQYLKLWMRVGYVHNTLDYISGGFGPYGSMTYQDDSIYGVSNPGNAPFGNLAYNKINPPGKSWIYDYTLALCKEMLGLIRNKYETIPIPGAEVRLNGADLISQGREDKAKLVDDLRALFDKLTADKLLEMDANKSKLLNDQLAKIPLPPKALLTLY